MTLSGPQFVRDKIGAMPQECRAAVIKCMVDGTPLNILVLPAGVEFSSSLPCLMLDWALNEATHKSTETFDE